jgi:uncharacterized membrane protein YgcG
MFRLLLLLCATAWPGATAAAVPTERVLSFHSDIQVRTDGRMLVTETIRVHALGKRIRRGIYRDFPTRYASAIGRVIVPFEVLRVMRDGNDETFRTEQRTNGVRLYIGRSDRRLAPGEYEFQITYRTDWQLGYFREHDELNWNVTGNGWAFPIDSASATVRLPQILPANTLRLYAYTGPAGAKGKAWRASIDDRGAAEFSTTMGLAPTAGLTIVVGWPKGVVAERDKWQKLARWSHDNPEWQYGAIGLIVLLAYYLVVWSQVGRDPAGGTIIPRFAPPDNVSAADARYLRRMGFDERVFAAGLISLAVKGYVQLAQNPGGDFTVKAAKSPSQQALSDDEQALLDALNLGQSGQLELKQANHAKVGSTRKALEAKLKKEHLKRHFITNSLYTVPGLLLTAAAIAGIALNMTTADAGSVFMIVWLTIWTFGVYFLLTKTWLLWREAIRGKAAMILPALFLTAFATPFVGAELLVLGMLLKLGSQLLVVMLIIYAGINYGFYHWLKAPTYAGRMLYDALAGFRMYLAVAEKDRLNALNAPERTPELFEKYLPYALALDVENEWAEQFADVLKRARREDGGDYHPGWHSGMSWNTAAVSSFTGGLAGAISASSSPPGGGTSGGGGGGGSSGGGGGGGGGGGW